MLAGFDPTLQVADITLNGGPLSMDVSSAIVDCIVERTISGASTVTPQLSDPSEPRKILNSGLFSYGDTLTINGLNFTMVQYNKTGDQLQLTFEAQAVSQLRGLNNSNSTALISTTTTDITGFAQQVCLQAGVQLFAEPNPISSAIAVARGTSADPEEDSWTCLSRIAATAGWRVWENENVIYFGSDPYWMTFPNQAVWSEFTQTTPNIDFDADVGMPLGNCTVTAQLGMFDTPPGALVYLDSMGPATGYWLVYDIQRDMYNPQATITLSVPLTPEQLIAGGASTSSSVLGSQPGLPDVTVA